MPQAISIDNFIDAHRDDERVALCGKLAIVRCILKAEADSKLKIDERNANNKLDFSGVAKTWFNGFFQLVTENCAFEQAADRLKTVAIVSFNYDRCVEHYLYHALRNYYGVSEADAARAVAGVEIHHPYGVVGQLPWMSAKDSTPFGAGASPAHLYTLAKQLRTFTEGADPATSNIAAIREAVCNTRQVVFLGFAFHRLNVDLLFPGEERHASGKTQSLFATAFGISDADLGVIRSELANKAGYPQESMYLRQDRFCSGLFSEFKRKLALA